MRIAAYDLQSTKPIVSVSTARTQGPHRRNLVSTHQRRAESVEGFYQKAQNLRLSMLPHRTISTRTQVVLLCIALVGTAGCSGLVGTADEGTGATATPTPTGPPYQNLSADEDVLATHEQALRQYDSVTVHYRQTITPENGSEIVRTVTARYDFSGDDTTVYLRRSGGGADARDRAYYTVDGITYIREETETGTEYRKREAAEQPRTPLVQGDLYFYQFGEAEQMNSSGGPVFQYEVTEPEHLTREGIIYYGEQKVRVDGLNISVNTTASGAITEYDQRLLLDIGTIETHYELVSVGSTTVERPDWVSDAKAATADETPAPAPSETPATDGDAVAA